MKEYKQITTDVGQLSDALNELTTKGWQIEYVMPVHYNGYPQILVVYSGR